MRLALANLVHHLVRSILSAMAVGIGVAMLVTLIGLTHGTLDEIVGRMRAVQADLLVAPRDFNTLITGAPFSEKHVVRARELPGRPIERVAPVFLGRITINRPDAASKPVEMHNAFGIREGDWDLFLPAGGRIEGRSFRDMPDEPAQQFQLLSRAEAFNSTSRPDENLAPLTPAERELVRSAFEIVIDRRLADVSGIKLGEEIEGWGRRFRVVGIAPTGVSVRVFLPLATVQFIQEQPGKATFLFTRLRDGADKTVVRKTLETELGGTILTIEEYSNLITRDWASVPDFTLTVSIITLVVAFLFVLVIMYTVVIQRTREIGILKSLGAGGADVVATVLAESMILSAAGTAVGLAMSCGARAAIMHFRPLMTVDLRMEYLAAGVATGLLGGLLSGLYPAYVALRQDPVTALNYE